MHYRRKVKDNNKINNNINSIKDNVSENKNLSSKENSVKSLNAFEKKESNDMFKSESYKEDKESKRSESQESVKEDLNDYELNDLGYKEALQLDNRSFFRIYWYLLKREHIILFTFYNWNDYNLFSIKLSKLFLTICSDMAFNVFFFSDESMHNLYVTGGEFDFIGQFAQFVYSTIISQILQTFVNYLTILKFYSIFTCYYC